MKVIYEGIPCRLLEYYMDKNDGPYVMIINASDKDIAYEKGFVCLGYPTEMAKKITKEEYLKFIHD